MAKDKMPYESKERIKNLRKQAYRIINRMDEYKLFGFIVQHKGRKAIPWLVKLWEEVVKPEKKVEPPKDLIELVVEKPEKGE